METILKNNVKKFQKFYCLKSLQKLNFNQYRISFYLLARLWPPKVQNNVKHKVGLGDQTNIYSFLNLILMSWPKPPRRGDHYSCMFLKSFRQSQIFFSQRRGQSLHSVGFRLLKQFCLWLTSSTFSCLHLHILLPFNPEHVFTTIKQNFNILSTFFSIMSKNVAKSIKKTHEIYN